MSGIKNNSSSPHVRPTIVRRTIVGSLVVMLAPFLTVLDSDADASVVRRIPIIYHSAPAEQLWENAPLQLLTSLPSDSDDILEMELREVANETWSN